MKHINTDEAKNIIVHIKPNLIDYLVDYYTERIQKETFRLINNLNKSLKYLISTEEKQQLIEKEIKINLESEHLELFKRLKFSINNNELIIDRNWLLDILEEYPNKGINLTFLNNPKLAFGNNYKYIEISDENELYEDLENEKPDFINQISLFVYVDYLIENEKKLLLKKDNNTTVQEELNLKQVQVIGLLMRSGIIDFLFEKNPKITKNQISKFIDIITKENLKQASVNSHLVDSESNIKHPFYKNGSVDNIDLILKSCGINPKSDN